MTEQFFILCGGIGNRLACLNIPKALAPIPKGDGMEPILARIIRLVGIQQFVLCLGWEAHLFDEKWPTMEREFTFDVEHPTGAADCVRRMLIDYECDRYTFLLGDVIWSKGAMDDFMSKRAGNDIVFYHDKHPSYSETYALSIDACAKDKLLEDFNVTTIPALPGEVTFYKSNFIRFDQARLGGLRSSLMSLHQDGTTRQDGINYILWTILIPMRNTIL